MIYGDVGELQLAIADLVRVVKSQPYNKEAHHKLGTFYARLDDEAGAERHRKRADALSADALLLVELKRALSERPRDNKLRERVAELYTRLGQEDEAERLLLGRRM